MLQTLRQRWQITLLLAASLPLLVQTTAIGGPQTDDPATAPAAAPAAAAHSNSGEATVTLNDQTTFTGRIVTQTPEGHLLLEEANGTYRQIAATTVVKTESTGQPFFPFNAQQTGAYLQQQMPTGTVTITDHFVICSAASSRYTQFCGQLLERVVKQFPVTLQKADVELEPIPSGLSVLIFASSKDLQAFAQRQHPEVDFTDTPGYYSVTHNQILFSADHDAPTARTNSDIARSLRKSPRIVETMVHETVHLLQYNSGLMNRFAANPTWLAEGMAVYFEPSSSRSSMLWNRPGDTSSLHLVGLKAAAAQSDFGLPFETLVTDDQTFARADSVRSAYAESWAITWTLMKRHPEAYGRLLNAQKSLQPLVAVTADDRVVQVEKSLGMTLKELGVEVRKAFRRQL